MAQLHEMIRAWEEARPRRAAGSRYALSGFCFQFNGSLLQFFSSIAGARIPDAAAFDRLSDYAIADGGSIQFVQYKRTLRKATYLDAVGEFLEVETLIRARFPGHCDEVRYQIVTSRVDDHLNTRQPPNMADVNCASTWQKIVAEGRFAGIDVQPDPWHELLQLLWPRLKRPAMFIARCNQEVFATLAGAERDVTSLSRRLIEAYESDKCDVHGAQSPWLTLSNMKPSGVTTGTILTGQRPTPRDWRDGCFMPRLGYLNRVADILREILRPPHEPLSQKLPVLWITGGSGVGKSGLLLASLERAMRDEDIDCAWVTGSPMELRETLEKVPQQRVIIGIDDLYAPSWREPVQWEHLALLARERSNTVIWIASAPTEYFKAFQQHVPLSGLFEHREIAIEPLNDEESVAYALWYVERTGVNSETITVARGDRNFLLAALRYQLLARSAVTLEEFTTRLWERLTELDIEESIAVALAAIRLGMRAPASLFEDPRSRDGLNKLDKCYLFLVRESEQRDGSVTSQISTHRRLAEQLYTQRFPANEPHVRASHLVTFWQYSDAGSRETLIDVVGKKDQPIESELAFAFLVALGKDLACERPSSEAFARLEAWNACALRRDLPDTHRREALDWLCRLVSAHDAIGLEYLGNAYALCWPLVLAPNTEAALKIRDAARAWLDRQLHTEHWNQVWQRFWDLPSNSSDRPALIELARRWLASHREHIGWTYIFQKLFDAGVRDTWLGEEAKAALRVLPANPVEHPLIRKVADLLGPVDQVAELWICRLSLQTNAYLCERAREHLSNLRVEVSTPLIELVADEHANAVGAGTTLQFLLSLLKSSPPERGQYHRLSRAVLRWLTGREDRPEWTHVWRRLIEVLPTEDRQREGLLRTGLAWLTGREDRPEWNYVWQHLIEALPTEDRQREGLLHTGLTWLTGREDRPEWNYVWQKLLAQPLEYELRRLLCAAGKLWLESNPNHPGCSAVRATARRYCF